MPARPDIILRFSTAQTLDCERLAELSGNLGQWTADALAAEIELVYSHIEMASVGTQLVAFLVQWTVAGEIQLQNLVVHKSFRRQGIARVLVQRLIERGIGDGLSHIDLEVRSGNVAARNLYGALDFDEQAVRPGYYSDPTEDAVLMRRLLQA